MAKFRGTLTLILCLFAIFLFTVGDGDQERKPTISEMLLQRVFSFSTTTSTASKGYWEKAKTLVMQAEAYYFPPNLDFRGSDEAQGNGGGGGAGAKVKEAVVKSLGKSKVTVEDSARSAGKLAGETVQKTTEKVKRSFSERGAEPQAEL